MSHKKLVIIYGPTAVGKTEFVYALARRLPIAIINMDVGQFYTPLTIGTAKPDWQSICYRMSTPHYLFDIHDQPVHYTVHEYRNKIIELLPVIAQQNRIPVLVGGSGFYVKSLLFPPQAPHTESHNHTREYSWELLFSIDPERANAIDPHDHYRIARALDLWYETGQKPSRYKPVYQPPAPYQLVFLDRERNQLYQAINERVVAMIKQGWLDEVKALKGTAWEPFLQEKKLIGYQELLMFLDNPCGDEALQRVIHQIQQETRHYAKRQITFWRMIERQCTAAIQASGSSDSVTAFNLTLESIDLYINRLVQNVVSD